MFLKFVEFLISSKSMFNQNPYYDGYPYDAVEPLQMWPPDQRRIEAQSLYPDVALRGEGPLEHLSWFHPPGKEPHWRHPYIPPESPPTTPEWHRKWLELPDIKPLETNASIIEDLSEDLLDAHNSIRAPFASPAWGKLVNWRQRETARQFFARHEDRMFGHYIDWAEGRCQDMVNVRRSREAEMERARDSERRKRSESEVVLFDMAGILKRRKSNQ